MTTLSVSDIFADAMVFDTRDGLLFKSAIRINNMFETKSIDYYVIGGYALIRHGVVRNTKDIDVVVHEKDFVSACHVMIDLGYTKMIGDDICARFQHEMFLPVDLLTSPIYATHPIATNRVLHDGIYFCDLPMLVQTKVKAMIGRPLMEEFLWKKMRDRVDICELIVTKKLNQEFAKRHNLELVVQLAYERVFKDYYNQLKSLRVQEKVSIERQCVCS